MLIFSQRGEQALECLRLGAGIERRGNAVHEIGYTRSVSADGGSYGGDVPDEYAGIPKIVAVSQIGLGRTKIRLLLEGLHGKYARGCLVACEDVAVARLGAGRLDAYSDYGAGRSSEIQGQGDVAAVLFVVQDESVRGRNDYICLRMT